MSVDTDDDGLTDAGELSNYNMVDDASYRSDVDKTIAVEDSKTVRLSFDTEIEPSMLIYPAKIQVYLDGRLIYRLENEVFTSVEDSPTILLGLNAGNHVLRFRVQDRACVSDIQISGVITDPFLSDTDFDSLSDREEISLSTDPTNPDTDNDGLIDGNEQWSQTWSSDDFYKVPNGAGNNGRPCVKIAIPSIPGEITSIRVHVGIVTDRAQDIEVWVTKDGTSLPSLCLYYRAKSGANIFATFVPLSSDYTTSVYAQGGTFSFWVADWNSAGSDGQVQYVKLEINGKTNPLDADSDDDGILDGEEVNLGTDGWITNPMLKDTDSDGLNDRNEIIGSTPCGKALNPTNPDTDGDGFGDGVDRGLGNMLLEIDIGYYSLRTGHSSNGIFFVIYFNGETFATARVSSSGSDANLKYYFEVPDDLSNTSLDIQAWEDGPTCNWFREDYLMKMHGSSTCENMFYNFERNSYTDDRRTFTFDGTDIYFVVDLRKVSAQLTNTVVISGVHDGESYGLDKIGDNNYRYNADEQLYIIYLDCTQNGNSHFVKGLNTILLPRSVALESKLNWTFEDLPNRLDGTVLAGAELYSTDAARPSSSGNVIIIISVTLDSYWSDQLLQDITHDHAGKRIGDNITVTGNGVYLLGLPKDVLNSIVAMDLANSPFGGAPKDLKDAILGGLFELFPVQMVALYAIAILVGNFHADMEKAAVELGLKFLAELKNLDDLVNTKIDEAVDAIVGAFEATVAWAKEFILNVIDETIGPLISEIQNAVDNYCAGILSAAMTIEAEYRNDRQVSSGSTSKLIDAILGDLFWVMIGVVVTVSIAIIAMKVATMGIGSLISYAVTSIASVLIVTALGAAMATIDLPPIGSSLSAWIKNLIRANSASAGGEASATAAPMSATSNISSVDNMTVQAEADASPGDMVSWAVDFACGVMDMIFTGALLTIKGLPPDMIKGARLGLVFGLASIAISTFAIVRDCVVLDVIGLALGVYAVAETSKDKNKVKNIIDPSAREILTMSGIVSTTAVATGLANSFI